MLFLPRNGMCRSYFFKPVPSPKKRRLFTSLAKCLICQKSSEGLTIPRDVGYSTFIKAVRFRFEAGEEELYRRLESFLDEGCTSIHERYWSQIKWHKSCYPSTTSKKNLSHLKNEQEITEVEGENSSASEIHIGDFSKLMANVYEAVYHKGCHANFTKIKEKVPQSERDAAFTHFLE